MVIDMELEWGNMDSLKLGEKMKWCAVLLLYFAGNFWVFDQGRICQEEMPLMLLWMITGRCCEAKFQKLQ